MGRQSISTAAICAALDQVGLLSEIRALPAGIATVLSHTGSPLSTGQLRLLMVARALVGNPRVLILDCILDEVDDLARARLYAQLTRPDSGMVVLILTRRSDTEVEANGRIELTTHGRPCLVKTEELFGSSTH